MVLATLIGLFISTLDNFANDSGYDAKYSIKRTLLIIHLSIFLLSFVALIIF